jgi:hypothetical protein
MHKDLLLPNALPNATSHALSGESTMAQNYRQQNESGRWQDYPRSGQRSAAGRDRFETGNERRFRPDWEERFYEGNQGESFEGDRSYSAGGYPEEFGYRREQMAEPERGSYRYGSHESPEDRFGSRYYELSQRQGQNADYGSRDFGRSGSLRSQGQGQRYAFEQNEGYRGEDFNRSRSDHYGSGFYGSGSSRNYYGPQGGFGTTPAGTFGRDTGNDRQMQQQSYRGRGPKGYERSDERLREMICERLTDDPAIDASEVTVEVTNQVVKLSGTVEERRMKYLVEDVIEQVGGVRDIDNQLRVQPAAQAQTSSYGISSNDSGLAGRGINVGQSGNLGQSGTSPAKRN